MMQCILKHAKERPQDWRIAEVVVDMDKQRNVRSWALVHRAENKVTQSYPDTHILMRPSVHMFTRPQYRRQGYGTKVMCYIAKHYGPVFTSPWDKKSKAFFKKVREQNKK